MMQGLSNADDYRLHRRPVADGRRGRYPAPMSAREEERNYDEYLAASARVGDPAAFNVLARRWENKLQRHA
jgi:hypothetical protein